MNLYEQKYNEILEWARKNKARLNGVPIEEVLPELAESEDERIRHWLIGLISADYKDENFPSGIKKTDVLNWLKKESVVYEQGMYYYDGKKFLYCQQEKPKVATPTLDSVKQNKSEDEEMLNSIINVVCGIDIQPSIGLREKQVRFLKSLKPYWKPSEDELAKRHLEGYIMGREDTMREMKDFIESHFSTQSGTSTLKAEG